MKIELDKQFFTGGNATFTVEQIGGTHYTFKIRRPRGDDKPLFASLLSGPDNENDYTYLGMVVERDEMKPAIVDGRQTLVPTGRKYLHCKMTAKSRMNVDSVPVKAINWVLRKVSFNEEIDPRYAVHHEGKCGCCGRTLTVPESIKRGIGPECWSRICGA